MTFNKYKKYKILYDSNGNPYIKHNKKKTLLNDMYVTDRENNYYMINNSLYHVKVNYGIDNYLEIRPLF